MGDSTWVYFLQEGLDPEHATAEIGFSKNPERKYMKWLLRKTRNKASRYVEFVMMLRIDKSTGIVASKIAARWKKSRRFSSKVRMGFALAKQYKIPVFLNRRYRVEYK